MSESIDTIVLVLSGDVLGKHRLGDLESRVLRYLMQQEVSYRLLWAMHGSDYKRKKISGYDTDGAKRLDSIYFEIPLTDLVKELGVDQDTVVSELRVIFKQLTQNVFVRNKSKGSVDDNWCYEPLFTRVEINKKVLIVDMKGSVLNLLLTADMDQFIDSRFKSMYSSLVNNAIYQQLGVDPEAKDDLVAGFNNFRVTIDLEDLRKWTNCVDGKYAKFSHFKDRVLEVAKKEITNYGDYTLGYNVIKTGREVTGIEFIGTVKADISKDFRTGLLLLNGTQSDYLVMRALFAQRGIACTVEQAYELQRVYGSESVRYFLDDLNLVMADEGVRDKRAYMKQVQTNRNAGLNQEFKLRAVGRWDQKSGTVKEVSLSDYKYSSDDEGEEGFYEDHDNWRE